MRSGSPIGSSLEKMFSRRGRRLAGEKKEEIGTRLAHATGPGSCKRLFYMSWRALIAVE
jgi:hypothetical protein